ncbi:MAG: pyridoxamine 5'-phosphate oxidase family protein [Thermoflexales bacterium]
MRPTPEIESRLASERNIWLATVRANGTPHLVPIWFVWWDGRAWICTSPKSVKARNLGNQPKVMFALEDGDKPALAEGIAARVEAPFPDALADAFKTKYGWDINTDSEYGALFEIRVTRWLSWNTGSTQ